MKSAGLIIGLICTVSLAGQDSIAPVKAWTFSGYLKGLEWVRWDPVSHQAYATSLLHNRAVLKWAPGGAWTGRLELRNRLYLGDDVKVIPAFARQLRNESEAVHASVLWARGRSALLHSNLERAWLEYRKTNWQIRAGRQRINWGMTNTWNPNDIFNSYNFLDFDYEERPGSDAIRAQYSVNDLSQAELAAAVTEQGPVLAARYATNYRQYDLQWTAGIYRHSFTAGLGWAGSIRDAGFKGEAQFYADRSEGLSRLLLVMESDYMFQSGWYVSGTVLYNENGLHRPVADWSVPAGQSSVRNLMPARWNFLLGTSKEFTPIFSGSMNLVYAPGMQLLILFPSLHYNLRNNLDLDFIWQSFLARQNRFKAISHTGFLRLKWSF